MYTEEISRVSTNIKEINGERVQTFRAVIGGEAETEIEVGTVSVEGRDGPYGSCTYLELDMEGDCKVDVSYKENGTPNIKLKFGGNSERSGLLTALKYSVKVIEAQMLLSNH